MVNLNEINDGKGYRDQLKRNPGEGGRFGVGVWGDLI